MQSKVKSNDTQRQSHGLERLSETPRQVIVIFPIFGGQVNRKTKVITFCGLAGSSTWLVAVAGTTLAALSLASKVMTQAATIRKPGRRILLCTFYF